ncbi:MAG: SurA N-terminal domain-containing protein [Campylobacteraceae bacterium]|jgi:peptidyl-prolyl cis-trans isomerase D|nr:SurA N-terminal domain-containing protein [Campylobacteraceae bacterium]
MITWMQRHKKYLIVTVWVSVIAFVSAGFIGWGAYDFNLARSSSVAKVGERTISKQVFSRSYANYFEYYNSAVYNGELTQEEAQKVGLDKGVLDILIDEAVLLNFADEMGITVLDNEVIEAITADENFYENGSFNKDLYRTALRNAGFKPAEYEEVIKKQVTLNKLYAIVMNFPVTELEKEILGSAMFMEDRLLVSTVTVDDSEIKISENETKAHWDMYKDNFLTEKVYNFESIFVPLSKESLSEEDIKAYYEEVKYFYKDSEDRLLDYAAAKKDVEKALRTKNAEQDALKTYLAFKKGEKSAQKNVTVTESSSDYNVSLFSDAVVGEVLRPVQKGNGWEVLKLVSINAPTLKTYEDAKEQVLAVLKANKRVELLSQKSQARLKLFKGSDLGFVTRGEKNITGLTSDQSAQFINTVFSSKEKRGYVILGDKAYLYNIAEQRLPSEKRLKENDLDLENTVRRIRETEMRQKLINTLKPRYKIEQYYKG